MPENSSTGPSGGKRQLFARRQVYLRAGQDSQYVELSPLLQIGVALGFGVIALWLIGASYGAVSNVFGDGNQAALVTQLKSTEQTLDEAQQERDAALEELGRLAPLEAELAAVKTALSETDSDESGEMRALRVEIEQTQDQLEETRHLLSEAKSSEAALQARFEAEALTTSDESEKTAEEASSLHAQLEEAFGEIETLGRERDDATTKLTALSEELSAKTEVTDRNSALLRAATDEIERLRNTVRLAGDQEDGRDEEYEETIRLAKEQAAERVEEYEETIRLAKEQEAERVEEYEETIGKLDQQLLDITEGNDSLRAQVDTLSAELDEAQLANSEVLEADTALVADVEARAAATVHAQSIEAGLKEAELLATIDELRAELASSQASDADDVDEAQYDEEEVAALRQRVNLAESEVEHLMLSGLRADDEPASASSSGTEPRGPAANAERLRTELLAARADNIKLKADVKAANQRLAEKVETDGGRASRSDNSAKLEQQLASTRSRVQQLNKALAEAKLREVAIDLALISVVPSPSPPAPR